MKLKIFGTISLLVLALSFASVTSADGIEKRIRFAKGKHSAIVSGAVVRGDRDVFTIGAAQGQKISVKITSPEKNAVFQIKGADDEFEKGAGEADDATVWSSYAHATGDYKIIVGGTRGNASYKLTVTIK